MYEAAAILNEGQGKAIFFHFAVFFFAYAPEQVTEKKRKKEAILDVYLKEKCVDGVVYVI